MAGKNITIAGAVFNGVPSIDVPVSGGGTASFVEISDTTAQAADVASGKYFYDASGVKTEGTASGGVDVEALSVTANGTYTAPTGKAYSPVTVNVSGGGGASNIVTGTFKGTTTGAAMEIDLPYTGSGYPVAFMVYPKGGMDGNPDIGGLVQRYAIAYTEAIKYNESTPTYFSSGTNNMASVFTRAKSSASDATKYSNSTSDKVVLSGADPNSNATGAVSFKSATKMSVFIASSLYGFAANIEYTYHVIYSE